MRLLIDAAGLALLLSLTVGCVPGSMVMADPASLSPEQMEAMKALGYDAVRCATVKGPPPGGTVSSVTIPKDRPAIVKFVGCEVQSIEVGK